jgi:hypothetical protein
MFVCSLCCDLLHKDNPFHNTNTFFLNYFKKYFSLGRLGSLGRFLKKVVSPRLPPVST